MPLNPQFDETDGGFDEKAPPPPLDKNQKIAAVSLAVFAVLIVILWVAQLRNNIYGPFNAPAGNQVAQTGALDQAAKDAALKTKDTDGDGLSDYDELYVYHTSPYLSDTDSDGTADGVEIKNGTDPNCPVGRDCASTGLLNNPQATGTPAASNDTLNSLLNQFGAVNPASQPTTTNSTASLNSDQLNALKNIDAASLRQLLLQNGMDKATLDKISDTDLLKSCQETLNGQ